MATFLHHEGCPRCHSSDNLGVYDDGSKWCFGCGHYIPSMGTSISAHRPNNQVSRHCKLPEDFSFYIPQEGLTWLKKYGISQQEIQKNKFGWSATGIFLKKQNKTIAPILIFPIYDNYGQLLMWQGRNFGEGVKYITLGLKDECLHTLGGTQGNMVILTEDLLSAIKVSRITSALPLWGSNVSLNTIKRLSKRFKQCKVWLDMDKAKEGHKQALKASLWFEGGCTAIRTEKDPKEYNNEEIKEILK